MEKKICVFCGEWSWKEEEAIMRKMFGRVLAGVLVTGLVLTGCGGGKEPSGGGTAGTETAGADGTGAVSGSSGLGNGSGSVGVDTTGFLMDVLNADIQTADVQKTTKDYTVPTNIFDRLADIQVDDQGVSKIVPSLASTVPVTAITNSLRSRSALAKLSSLQSFSSKIICKIPDRSRKSTKISPPLFLLFCTHPITVTFDPMEAAFTSVHL